MLWENQHEPYFASLQKCKPNFLLHRTSSLLFDMYTLHTNFKLWWSQTFTNKIQFSFCHGNIPICLLGLHINLFFYDMDVSQKPELQTMTSSPHIAIQNQIPIMESQNGRVIISPIGLCVLNNIQFAGQWI